MRIDVTQDDIDQGKRPNELMDPDGDPYEAAAMCPVAIAFTHCFQHEEYDDTDLCYYRGALVTAEYAFINGERIRLPDDVYARIINYDCGDEMKPFSFDVDLSNCVQPPDSRLV